MPLESFVPFIEKTPLRKYITNMFSCFKEAYFVINYSPHSGRQSDFDKGCLNALTHNDGLWPIDYNTTNW